MTWSRSTTAAGTPVAGVDKTTPLIACLGRWLKIA
jgi:hypothetical protein